MVAGIRVRNQYFTTQIDHNYKNYGFVQVIPVNVVITSPSVDEQGIVQVTVPGINSLVGVRSSLFFYFPMGSFFDGTNWIYTFKFMPPVAITGTQSETVSLFVFNTLESGGLSNIGIRIRHPVTGEIGFHSDMRPLYMEAKSLCTSAFGGTPGQIYCPIITRLCFINNFYAGLGFRAEPFGLRCSGSTIEVRQFTLPSYYALFNTYYDPGEYSVINVTGLS